MVKDLIEKILLRLEQRRQSSTTITIYDEAIYSEEILLNHEQICLAGLHYGHLQSLANNIQVPWVRFLDTAISYDCRITLKLSVLPSGLLSHSMIRCWPVVFRDKLNRRLYACTYHWIPAGFVRACESNSVLVLHCGQRLTQAAIDECSRLSISTVEGSD